VNRLKTGLFLALLLPGVSFRAFAQNQSGDAERLKIELAENARREAEQREWDTKIFQIKYVDPGELQRALSMFRGNITYSGGGLRVLSVRAPKEIMPAIEDAIKRLDVPSPRRDAELTIFVLVASDQPDPAATVPQNLQPVVNQLKNVLSYKGYTLLDTLLARGGAGRSNTATNLNGTLGGPDKPTYNFSARFMIDNPDGKTPVLRLADLVFGLESRNLYSVRIGGDVEIPQGQQVVVGKATMGERALILVMTAKFSN
jgi:hypothetical protein